MSCETSAEGGGAITDGAGKFSFELRAVARSGAETGGGTTAGWSSARASWKVSRLTSAGRGRNYVGGKRWSRNVLDRGPIDNAGSGRNY